MSIVLVIVGLILATLLPGMIRSVARDVMKTQKRAVEAARDEVVGYVYDNGFLPPDQAAFSALANSRDITWRVADELDGSQIIEDYGSSDTSLTVVIESETSVTVKDVAFLVVHPGVNRQLDQDYTQNTITIERLGEGGFDDIVDFAILSRLREL
jgi:type II secretory pathway pseudopilin PulG